MITDSRADGPDGRLADMKPAAAKPAAVRHAAVKHPVPALARRAALALAGIAVTAGLVAVYLPAFA
ncbi:hypothetical protein GCM10009760_31020 [Kitasatospora kazusensis]|uniref:Uncharacterized protein n=1 Tax=Kitasatospora kazusensis TaxID=407974 RepID=A0ABP5LEQ9_9ACTN